MMRYTSDLTDKQFVKIEPYLPKVRVTKPRKWSRHEIMNGIMYVVVTWCQRRNLPKDLPPWKTVYHYFSKRKKEWVLDKIMAWLHSKVRKKEGKKGATNTMTDGFSSN